MISKANDDRYKEEADLDAEQKVLARKQMLQAPSEPSILPISWSEEFKQLLIHHHFSWEEEEEVTYLYYYNQYVGVLRFDYNSTKFYVNRKLSYNKKRWIKNLVYLLQIANLVL